MSWTYVLSLMSFWHLINDNCDATVLRRAVLEPITGGQIPYVNSCHTAQYLVVQLIAGKSPNVDLGYEEFTLGSFQPGANAVRFDPCYPGIYLKLRSP